MLIFFLDEAILLEKFDYNIVHNYSENMPTFINEEKTINNEDKENEKKSEFVKNMHDLDQNKTIIIDYWNSIDKIELQTTDQTSKSNLSF